MNKGKGLKRGIMVLLVVLLLVPAARPAEAAGPSVTTTLTDDTVQRGSKKTFDVWAKNEAGQKIKVIVKLNGEKVEPTWDDNEKTSYTLIFTKEGENIVTVSASSDGGKRKELVYHITYQKTGSGEAIGWAVWSVEAFTIGCGYLIYPVAMPIYEGETSAEQLIRLLHTYGFVGYYGGSLKSSFYLAYIADGTASAQRYNNYQKSGTPSQPQKLNLSPAIPSILVSHLQDTMTFYDPDDYGRNWEGYLGEFAFTNGSGWMYSVNNIFPNVGFADTYLSDGDVVRVQYTLGYGADIGGFGAMGTEIPNVDNQPTSGYYSVANKDALTRAIGRARTSGLLSRPNVEAAYQTALQVMATLNASQGSVSTALNELNYALANPEVEPAQGNTSENDSSRADSHPTATETESSSVVENSEISEEASSTEESSMPEDSQPNTDSSFSPEKERSETSGRNSVEEESGNHDNTGVPYTAWIVSAGIAGLGLAVLAAAAVMGRRQQKMKKTQEDEKESSKE